MQYPLLIADYGIERDYSFAIGKYHFGFVDADQTFEGEVTLLQLGPLGEFHHVPFSAAHGWLIVGLGFAALFAGIAATAMRFRHAIARHILT